MGYIIGYIVLVALEGAFLVLTRRRHLGAAVTARSSHTAVTPTAGGVVVVAAAAVCVALHHGLMTPAAWTTAAGALLLAIVSFVDDFHPLPTLPRLLAQFAAVAAAFYWLFLPLSPWLFVLALFCGVAFVNVFNFLDGIRCMFGFYSLVTVGTLWYVFASAAGVVPGLQLMATLCVWLILGLAAFLVFNLQDRIFSGDTGSVFLGFVIAVMLTRLIIYTGDVSCIVFVIVCLCDTALTTLIRLCSGKNILKPHRTFIYQLLTVRGRWTHMQTAAIYAALQLVINLIFLSIPATGHIPFLITVTILLCLIHLVIRHRANA